MILPMALSLVMSAGKPTAVELTIYNQGFGLVKEVRSLTLKEGRQDVAVEDVAARIEPTSVGIKSLSPDGDVFKILEQNYQYDLISPQAILDKSVGGRVRLVRWFGTQKDVLEGTLLSSPSAIVAQPGGGMVNTYNGLVIKADDGRIVLNPTGEVEVTTVPAGLISKPTLIWDLKAPKAVTTPVEVSYISQGLSWNADYVLTIDGQGSGDLQGWVTLNNQSGTTWENAKLKLLAGDVNRPPMPVTAMAGAMRAMDAVKSKADFQEEQLFEYHLYTLQRPATVRNKETKQVSLLAGYGVPVEKKMIIDATRQYGRFYPGEGEIGTGNIKPQVRLEFINDEKSGLGIPLPKGDVKIYQRDKSGSVQLLGEDRIDHTPRNERLSLVVGRAFDVVANRKRTNYQRIDDRTFRETFEIEVRNRKETPETVLVYERHYGDWKVLDKSQEFTKADSETMVFSVNLAANDTKKVTYTVQTKW